MVSSDVNLGYAGGCNLGALHASGEYLFFLNVDTRTIDRLLFLKVMGFFEEFPSAGIVQPTILDWDGRTVQSGGMNLVYPTCFTFQVARGEHYAKFRCQTPYEAFAASGAAFCITRGAFKKVGGFDAWFETYFEDTDMAWRLQKLGYKTYVLPRAFVCHFFGHTTRRPNARVDYLYARNVISMLVKNADLASLLRLGPPTLGILIMERVVGCFVSGNVGGLIALIRAFGEVLICAGLLVDRRRRSNQLGCGNYELMTPRVTLSIFTAFKRWKEARQSLSKAQCG
jgi:hypothetical protein